MIRHVYAIIGILCVVGCNRASVMSNQELLRASENQLRNVVMEIELSIRVQLDEGNNISLTNIVNEIDNKTMISWIDKRSQISVNPDTAIWIAETTSNISETNVVLAYSPVPLTDEIDSSSYFVGYSLGSNLFIKMKNPPKWIPVQTRERSMSK